MLLVRPSSFFLGLVVLPLGAFTVSLAIGCGSGPEPLLPNEPPPSGPPANTYAEVSPDAVLQTSPSPDAAPPSPDASVTTNVDAGSSGDAAPPPPPPPPKSPCEALADCCAQPKACAEESSACQHIVHTNDPQECQSVLNGYKALGCTHDPHAIPDFVPHFWGCYTDPGNGGGGGG